MSQDQATLEQAEKHVERHDVKAVNRKADRSLYAKRQSIYPKAATGTFRRIKWTLMIVCLGIYYIVPWIRWDRGPDLPNQAVLLDMQHERFFAFGLEIWPQEFYFVTGLLVLAAFILFLVTSLAGRVWCGYFCWQTVWTDLMMSVERFWQGDRNAHIRLDNEPWSARKVFLKTMTHISWLLIAVATGGAFVFYFADAPTLFGQLVTGTAPTTAYMFVGILTFTTYLLGGIAREQVCIYMCPWPRIQGALVDHESLWVSYKDYRGEPRGPLRKKQGWEGRGDCIDCNACVAVCPMGIDIRDGGQLECIQCALCIDACNEVMDKVDRPRGLVGYDTIARKEAALAGQPEPRLKLIRARTVIYASLIAFVGLLMLYVLSQRTLLEVNVLADRNPFYVRLANGDIRNGYTIKILNKLHEPRNYELLVDGIKDAKVTVVGHEGEAPPKIDVPTDVLREIKMFVAVPDAVASSLEAGGHPITILVKDVESGRIAKRTTTFRRP